MLFRSCGPSPSSRARRESGIPPAPPRRDGGARATPHRPRRPRAGSPAPRGPGPRRLAQGHDVGASLAGGGGHGGSLPGRSRDPGLRGGTDQCRADEHRGGGDERRGSRRGVSSRRAVGVVWITMLMGVGGWWMTTSNGPYAAIVRIARTPVTPLGRPSTVSPALAPARSPLDIGASEQASSPWCGA